MKTSLMTLSQQVTDLATTKPLTGGESQIAVFSAQNVVTPTYLVQNIQVVTNADEFTAAKQVKEDQTKVFNEYQRVSIIHTTKADSSEAVPGELNAWSLEGERIRCTINSASLVGFVGPESYEDFVFETNLGVINDPSNDNDFIGVFIGYREVNGRVHTLTYTRMVKNDGWVAGFNPSPGPKNAMLIKNFYGRDPRVIAQNSSADTGTYGANWNANPGGCRIRITRVGDLITCETTKLCATTAERDAAPYVAAATIVYNLASDEDTAMLRGPQRVGYCCMSQTAAAWDVITKPGGLAPIYHMAKGVMYTKVGNDWVISTLTETLTRGIFYNDANKKRFFYCTPSATLKEVF